MKKRLIVLGSFAALVVSSSALGGFIFFTDPAAFADALAAQNKVSKGFWDLKPNNMPPDFIGGFDDSLNINNIPTFKDGTPFWDADTMLDNVTFQSNMSFQGEGGPNPRGENALVVLANGAFGLDNNALLANTFVDGLDILSGPPAGDNHTAMALDVIDIFPLGDLHVTVWDKNEQNVAKINLGLLESGVKVFLGILATDGSTIGRVNIFDTLGAPGGGAEGFTRIEVWIPAPGAMALLGVAGLFVRRRRRR